MEMRKLTTNEKITLKLGIMSLWENKLISQITASWLIQSLGLSDA